MAKLVVFIISGAGSVCKLSLYLNKLVSVVLFISDLTLIDSIWCFRLRLINFRTDDEIVTLGWLLARKFAVPEQIPESVEILKIPAGLNTRYVIIYQ